MSYQEMLDNHTMVTTLDTSLAIDDGIAYKSQEHPMSGYLKPIDCPDKSFKLIVWSEDFDEPHLQFFNTLDVAAVIRADIDGLLDHVRSGRGEIAFKADDEYRAERDALRSSLSRLKNIVTDAIAEIDAQSTGLDHDTKETP